MRILELIQKKILHTNTYIDCRPYQIIVEKVGSQFGGKYIKGRKDCEL